MRCERCGVRVAAGYTSTPFFLSSHSPQPTAHSLDLAFANRTQLLVTGLSDRGAMCVGELCM